MDNNNREVEVDFKFDPSKFVEGKEDKPRGDVITISREGLIEAILKAHENLTAELKETAEKDGKDITSLDMHTYVLTIALGCELDKILFKEEN